jgi:hypothetical protein
MITGYNTDVRHEDVVFHVQTEDKGSSNPCIESLVYVGGQVLAARRASYTDLLEAGNDQKAVLARMEKQHRAMIAAIRRGKLDGKVKEVFGAPRGTGEVPQPAARPSTPTDPLPSFDQDGDRTLDQVILDYLSSEAEQEQLILMLDGDPVLEVGRPASLLVRTMSSKSGAPVIGAEVTVRMISTISEPRTLVGGETGDDGTAQLRFSIPDLGRGTAALIIAAACDFGRAELKQLL